MYIVEWTDHEGSLHQQLFDNRADAKLEAAYLEEKFDYVAIITEAEKGAVDHEK